MRHRTLRSDFFRRGRKSAARGRESAVEGRNQQAEGGALFPEWRRNGSAGNPLTGEGEKSSTGAGGRGSTPCSVTTERMGIPTLVSVVSTHGISTHGVSTHGISSTRSWGQSTFVPSAEDWGSARPVRKKRSGKQTVSSKGSICPEKVAKNICIPV